MRISDWSSDVCSSDLVEKLRLEKQTGHTEADLVITTITYLGLLSDAGILAPYETAHWDEFDERFLYGDPDSWTAVVYEIFPHSTIGRASCRERVCQYV